MSPSAGEQKPVEQSTLSDYLNGVRWEVRCFGQNGQNVESPGDLLRVLTSEDGSFSPWKGGVWTLTAHSIKKDWGPESPLSAPRQARPFWVACGGRGCLCGGVSSETTMTARPASSP